MRSVKERFKGLSRCAGKLASTVLRGESGSNVILLPDSNNEEIRYAVVGMSEFGLIFVSFSSMYLTNCGVSEKEKKDDWDINFSHI